VAENFTSSTSHEVHPSKTPSSRKASGRRQARRAHALSATKGICRHQYSYAKSLVSGVAFSRLTQLGRTVDGRAATCRRTIGFGVPLRLRESALSTSDMRLRRCKANLDGLMEAALHPRAVLLPMVSRRRSPLERYPKTHCTCGCSSLLLAQGVSSPSARSPYRTVCPRVPLERKLHRRGEHRKPSLVE
jgi:hypothetical protein